MSKDRRMDIRPRGEGKPWKAALLEQGAALLQDNAPVKQFDMYMVGFHCGKHDPAMQMEAHHYCRQVNGEFFQCVIFDGNTKDANLIGIEYIISERLFDELAVDEQARWHPHNYATSSPANWWHRGCRTRLRRRCSSSWSTATARPGTPG